MSFIGAICIVNVSDESSEDTHERFKKRTEETSEELWGEPPYKNAFLVDHKAEYIRKDKQYSKQSPDRCIICNIIRGDEDTTGYVIYRSEKTLVFLNLYPYTAGHTLISPLRHITGYEELEAEELSELSVLSQRMVNVLKSFGTTESFNAGWNQGQWSGGSIKHFHLHLVPRYKNDNNFIDIIGKSRTILHSLEDVEIKLKKFVPYLSGEVKSIEELEF